MSHPTSERVGTTTLLIAVTLVLALVAGCGSTNSSAGKPSSSKAASEPPGTQTTLPLTLDGIAAAVAVTDHGVFVADTGKGNKIDNLGGSYGDRGGRVLTLEAGASTQKDVSTNVGVPISLAAGPDGAIYVLTVNPRGVVQFPAGSTDPVRMPFEFGTRISDPSPWKIAVTPAGDVVVLTDRSLLLLPKGAQAAKAIGPTAERRFVAVDPKGAIYFVGSSMSDVIRVIDSGSTEPRKFEASDSAHPTKRTVAMAFDTNSDRYELAEECGPGQEPGLLRPCKAYVYSLSKFANNSATPTDMPVQGLTSATSVAVGPTGIYIADGNRIVKIAK